MGLGFGLGLGLGLGLRLGIGLGLGLWGKVTVCRPAGAPRRPCAARSAGWG